MKYIRYRPPGAFGDKIIFFEDHIVHADVGIVLRKSYCAELVSAGFATIDHVTRQIRCYGRSDSLNLKSGEMDSLLANRAF